MSGLPCFWPVTSQGTDAERARPRLPGRDHGGSSPSMRRDREPARARLRVLRKRVGCDRSRVQQQLHPCPSARPGVARARAAREEGDRPPEGRPRSGRVASPRTCSDLFRGAKHGETCRAGGPKVRNPLTARGAAPLRVGLEKPGCGSAVVALTARLTGTAMSSSRLKDPRIRPPDDQLPLPPLVFRIGVTRNPIFRDRCDGGGSR